MASRIFIKGLPPTFSEEELRKHFPGNVTDVRIFPNRRIGYVGYSKPEDAQKAVKYHNKSFIRMSRISVELARPAKEPGSHEQQQPSPPAQRREGGLPTNEIHSQRKREAVDDDDPKLKEFMDVMKPKTKKQKGWEGEEVPQEAPVEHTASAEKASDDEYEVLQKDVKTDAAVAPAMPHPEPVGGDDEVWGGIVETVSHAEPVDPAPTVSDADWTRSRTSRLLGLLDDDEEETLAGSERQPRIDDESYADVPAKGNKNVRPAVEDPANSLPSPPADSQTLGTETTRILDSASDVDAVRSSMRLFVRNLPYSATKEDLEAEFEPFGNLAAVHVSMSKKTGSAKGFAFIQYSDADAAERALREKDGQTFQGRLLHILPGKAKREDKLDDFELSKLPLKKQQEIKRRREASSKTFNWNALYMNADAVVSSVAERLGIAKSAVLDPTSSDAAVKQAHAETHVIQETKAYFKQHGVDLDSFKTSKRGDTAILAKNIPFDFSKDELKRRFEEHGEVKKFLMPPSGAIAIVEFANAEQCRAAYGALAYRRVKSSILFLEKAPQDLFNAKPATSEDTNGGAEGVTKTSASDLKDSAKVAVADSATTATLFVRNLNFSTTTQHLTETFSPLSGFLSARVKTKTDAKKPGQILSMGFGFLEFRTAQQAQAALQAMDGYTLDGHRLQIRASHKGADAAEERRHADAAKRGTKTKIIIKNLPFEATKKDVRALFGAFGQLRSVRVPKKMDRAARGFAFADFTTPKEAESAMEALRNTHLLGRRLVLDFAEGDAEDAEAEIERMQAKVGAQVNKMALQKLTGAGRKKFSTEAEEEG
ncbi:hypothetical protein BAUCODRAFT_120428 [Baudoinia panamericana UAMH 10762]|uniref:Multiple RNA-binding domain-containing protein 1 n=1 Tax=Baudoinia panamericana (strain UAMH 10762) TaxID=717646 RepID=M2MQQ1_BAUPA|nr:uncharacterized protein BAUCODRAFT_120428 [Baudoinia panamericana UAMH 10762]EMC99136.1 hypothetical protein BAUCODRAFT_120428 [Baudoinia panamericana UAMH 10762]